MSIEHVDVGDGAVDHGIVDGEMWVGVEAKEG